jgi:hypothetical protein
VDKQMILDILFIVVNEMQFGLYASARKHMQVVGRLYHLLDLNESLDRWISETAAHVDNQLALTTGQRPVLPYTFDPGPMLPERIAILKREARSLQTYGYPKPTTLIVPSTSPGTLTDAIADLADTLDTRMGSQMRFALKIGAFPGKLGTIVSDLVDCIEVAKVVWLSPLAVCFDAEWLCRKARSVLRALLTIAPENNIGPIDMISKCTECARLCLMILMTHACTLIGFQTAKSNVKRLKEAKSAALQYWCPSIGWTQECVPLDKTRRLSVLEETQAGFVLWGLLTGVWSSEGSGSGCLAAEEEWFMVRALNICRFMGLVTYEDLHGHMSLYMYSKSLQERSLRRTALRLQARSIC